MGGLPHCMRPGCVGEGVVGDGVGFIVIRVGGDVIAVTGTGVGYGVDGLDIGTIVGVAIVGDDIIQSQVVGCLIDGGLHGAEITGHAHIPVTGS